MLFFNISCFDFSYFMAGDDVGTLNVYYTYGGTVLANPFFTLSGNKGDNWFNQKFNFAFSGVTKIDVNKIFFIDFLNNA